jgi:hypothetical protein
MENLARHIVAELVIALHFYVFSLLLSYGSPFKEDQNKMSFVLRKRRLTRPFSFSFPMDQKTIVLYLQMKGIGLDIMLF